MGELEELEECTSKKNPHVLVDWIGSNKGGDGTSFNWASTSYNKTPIKMVRPLIHARLTIEAEFLLCQTHTNKTKSLIA